MSTKIKVPDAVLHNLDKLPELKLQRLVNLGGRDRDCWSYRKNIIPRQWVKHRHDATRVGKTVLVRAPHENRDSLDHLTIAQLKEQYSDSTTFGELRDKYLHATRVWVAATPAQAQAYIKAEATLMQHITQLETAYQRSLLRNKNTQLHAAYVVLAESGRMTVGWDGSLTPKETISTLGFGIMRTTQHAVSFVTRLHYDGRATQVTLRRGSLSGVLSWKTRSEAFAKFTELCAQTNGAVSAEYEVIDLDTAELYPIKGSNREYVQRFPKRESLTQPQGNQGVNDADH